MKKLMILVLVLGLASAANAVVVSYEFRDTSDNVITQVPLTSPNFKLVIVGDRENPTGGWGWQGRIYDAYEGYVPPVGSDHADFTSGAKTAATGATGAITPYDSTYDGFTCTAGDTLATGGGDGDWFVLNVTASSTGTFTVYNLASDWSTIVDTASITIIPEPMTIALLGLGGLFLRRRK